MEAATLPIYTVGRLAFAGGLYTGVLALAIFIKRPQILVVCTENLCRSPMAEGVLADRIKQNGIPLSVKSAGTLAQHPGARPDRRAQSAASERGIDLSKIRARRLTVKDIVKSELVLVMDQKNLRAVAEICPPDQAYKVQLFLGFLPQGTREDVPDPYYGSVEGFHIVFEQIERAVDDFLPHLVEISTK